MSSTLLRDTRSRSAARRAGTWRTSISGASARQWLARLTWAYVAVVFVACLVLWTLADRWWPATLFLFGPRWILLLPLAALVPSAAVLRRRLLAPLLVAALIVLVPTMGLRLGWGSWLEGPDGGALRVVTLNAGGSEALGFELPFRARDWNADIVAIQECGSSLASVVRDIPDWYHHVDGQLCVLSRHPIDTSRAISWDDLAGAREQGLGGSSHAAEYSITTPGGSVRVVNLHLETARKGLEGAFDLDFGRISANLTLRAAESRRMRDWIGEDAEAVIIVGDFNMPIESAIYRRDWSDFRNAFSDIGVGFGATRDNGWIQVRIDHVLTGSAWTATRAVVGPVVGVDHRPVIVDLARADASSVSTHAQPRASAHAPHRGISRTYASRAR